MNDNQLIQSSVKFLAIVNRFKGSYDSLSKTQLIDTTNALIEDIVFDINELGEVKTSRLFDILHDVYQLTPEDAILVIKEFTKYLQANDLLSHPLADVMDMSESLNESLETLKANETFNNVTLTVFEMLDKFCEEQNFPKIDEITLTR